MTRRRNSGTAVVTAVAALAAVAAALAPATLVVAADQPFTLTRAVPDDVFLCISARHNPEQVFVHDYWGEIWQGVKDSGVGSDFMDLIGGFLGADQMAEVTRLRDRASELFAGVDWSALGGGEFVYAQRMSAPQIAGSNVNMGPPDMLWLIRGENAETNYEGLVAIVEGTLEEIRKAAGPQVSHLVVVREERADVPVATVQLIPAEQHGVGFSVSMARHKDVIIITAGDRILSETLDLLAGEGTRPSLADSPRYQKAFSQLPAPEDAATYFDMQAMLTPFQPLINLAMTAPNEPEDVFLNAKDSGEAHDLGAQAIAAYHAGDHARAVELIQQAAAKDPQDSRVLYNLACFNALAGQRDEALAALTRAVDAGCYAPDAIAADPDFESLRDAPEYQQALAKAQEQAKAHAAAEGNAIKGLVKRIMDVPSMLDYIAGVGYTEGHSVHTKTVVALVPDAKERPFYPVISGKPEMDTFDRFLPEETMSFSVSGGFDINALYKFIEDTFKAAGEKGESLWAQWENWQKDADFDVRKNVLGWMGGDCVAVTLADNQGWVLLWRVKDEAVAREKVGAAVEFLSTKLVEAAAQQPALAMISVRKSPVQHEKLEGFQNLFFGMSPRPVIWGVADKHLILADNADAIVACLETAKGEHPSIRKNERVMSELLAPEGPFVSVSLSDQRALGQELAAAIGMVSMMSGFASMAVPPEARRVIGTVSGMLMKLTPVVSKINFFKSIASTTTFDGQAWHSHSVTHYVSPEERSSRAAK